MLRFVIIGYVLTALVVCSYAFGVSSIDGSPNALYLWRQGGTADWQLPSNWSPARTMPAPSDILVFDVGGATTPTNVPTETIGQLIVSGNTAVNLQAASAVVLTVGGGEADDLIVGPGSALDLNGSNAITCSLATAATARIEGSITFSSSGTAAHRLTAVDTNAVSFENDAIFTADAGFVGNPFGTTNINSVIFEAGSTYVSIAGSDPFGAAEPSSVVVFKKGSLFSLRADAQASFFSGRTYANFELNWPVGKFPIGYVFAEGSSALVMDDLTVTAGRLHLALSGDPGHSIKGNINLMPHAWLIFSSGTIRLNGTTTQVLDGDFGSQGADGGSLLVIDNPMGLFLKRPLLAWNLALLNGIVTVGPNNGYHHVGVAGELTRVNGFVNGELLRLFWEPGSYVYPIGTGDAYTPATVDVISGNYPSGLYISAFAGSHPGLSDPSKALARYWEVYETGDLTADVTFHYLDSDVPATATEANFLVQRYNGGFTQPNGVIDIANNTFRVNGLTDFGLDWTVAEPTALLPPRTHFDFDGDGRADISVFRPSIGSWYLFESTNGFTGVSFGNETDKIAPADFDGDGKTDVAVFRPEAATWFWLNSSNGTLSAVPFGASEDLPTPADYDGDGRADTSVFRPSNRVWYRLNSSNGSFTAVQFGASDDKPTIGDYDGDGRADVAVFRPSTGAWYRLNSSDGQFIGVSFGFSTDLITPADFDGDAKTDVAVYRPSAGTWFWLNSTNGGLSAVPFGTSEDVPVAADFDGDGRADVSVFRPSNGVWYRLNSGNGSFFAVQFGTSTDRPTPAAFRY